jgi:hypothetical protein
MLTVGGVQLLVSGSYPGDDECFIFQAINFCDSFLNERKMSVIFFFQMAFAILKASYLLSYTCYFMEIHLS